MLSSAKTLKRSFLSRSHRWESSFITNTTAGTSRCRSSLASWSSSHHLPHSTKSTVGRHFSQIHNVKRTPKHRPIQQLALFHTSPPIRNSDSPIVFADPDRPDLFYHLLEPPTHISRTHPVYGVSFFDSLESSPEVSKAHLPKVIGYLPAALNAQTAAVQDNGDSVEAGLNDFKENPRFREILHIAIKEGLTEGVDDIQNNAAVQLHQGWMHIHDDRNIPPLGRIGDPDDIIATVFVDNGKVRVDTYQPMPAYRLCTADGVLKLTEGLANKLKEVLVREK